MAFDGFVISNLVYELNNTILNAKISKIAQPETDELLFTLKGSNGQYRLAMSASASLPFLYLTGTNKPSPLTAPNFCMLLRKHIANGRIVEISQPHMERIINFKIEHLDEMGDLCQKTLIVELMGKRSNIIFCDANGRRKDRPNGGLYVTEAKAGKTVTAGGPGAETVIVEPIALDGDKMKPGERSGGSGMGVSEEGVMYTQTAGDVHGVAYTPSGKPTVRKLLPLECERLMGFPDNWTRIPWRGKPAEKCSDYGATRRAATACASTSCAGSECESKMLKEE